VKSGIISRLGRSRPPASMPPASVRVPDLRATPI
jgi:hypothetical protein